MSELKTKAPNLESQIVTNDVLTARFDELDRLRPQLLNAVRGQ